MIQKDKETVAAQTEAVKDSVQNMLKLKSVNVDITSARNSLGDFGFLTPFKLRRGKADGEFERFCDTLDKTVADKYVSAVKVTIKDTHNVRLQDLVIEKFSQDVVEAELARPKERERHAGGEAAGGGGSLDDFASQFLGLMGVDTAGVRDAKGALYTVALNFNKQNMERQFADQRREMELDYERKENSRKMGEAAARAETAERRVAELEKEKERLEAQVGKLEDELEEAVEAYKELQKVDPTNFRAGTALGLAGQFLLQRNAGAIGRILNIDGATLAGILSNPGQADGQDAAPPSEEPDVSVTPEDGPRAREISEVADALRRMTDKDFARAYKSVIAFAQQARQAAPQAADDVEVTQE